MTCGAGGGSRLNWIPLIELSRGVWMCAAALNTSRIFESESLTWMAEADCHARNGQTLQVCVSGSHCWDHEPALVCLSEKTANDCSLFLSPLFSLSLSLCIYISWSSVGTRIRCLFQLVFCYPDPEAATARVYLATVLCVSQQECPPFTLLSSINC